MLAGANVATSRFDRRLAEPAPLGLWRASTNPTPSALSRNFEAMPRTSRSQRQMGVLKNAIGLYGGSKLDG